MKSFKIVTIFLVIIFLGFILYYFYSKEITYNPISIQNNFYKNLDIAINTAKLKTSSYQVRDFNDEVEFYLISDDNQVKVLVSTLKNPFWQISTLQQVVKTAKINQGKLKLVDLSSKHPYATYKNN